MNEENQNTIVDKHELEEDKEKMIRKVLLSLEGPTISSELFIGALKANFEELMNAI